jgi:hypothetical protein
MCDPTKQGARRYAAAASLIFALLAANCSLAYGLGADYGREELAMRAGDLGGQTPVHGYWVNWEDVFFYSGDAKAFNRFIAAYGELKHCQLEVVVHRGLKQAGSPWRQLDLPADWSLYVWNNGSFQLAVRSEKGEEAVLSRAFREPAPTRVDVWIGPRLRVQDLRIPAALKVAAACDAAEDDEIKAFLERRRTSPDHAPDPAPKPCGDNVD